MPRSAGTNLSNDHRASIAAGMRRRHEEKRDKNYKNFWRSMFALERQEAEAAVKAAEIPVPASAAPGIMENPPTNDEVEHLVEENRQPIVANLDIQDNENDENEQGNDRDADNDTIMHKYIHAIQNRLQIELSSVTDEQWLLNILKSNDWWILKHKYKSICRKLNLVFEKDEMEGAYFQNVYVWLPDERWGTICMPACPKCKSNKRVGNNGFWENHFGRRVVALDHDYYCLSR